MSTSKDFEKMTNSELIEEIDRLEHEIEQLDAAPDAEPDPGHDLYRAVMFLECMSCGNRYVDEGECPICRPDKVFLKKWRSKYPWKSDQIGPAVNVGATAIGTGS